MIQKRLLRDDLVLEKIVPYGQAVEFMENNKCLLITASKIDKVAHEVGIKSKYINLKYLGLFKIADLHHKT